VIALAALVACRGPLPTEHALVRLRDVPIAEEIRTGADARTIERRYPLASGEVVTRSTLELHDGHVTRFEIADREWTGDAWWLEDAAPRAPEGDWTIPVFDPASFEVRQATLRREGNRVHWKTDVIDGDMDLAGDEVVRSTVFPLSVETMDTVPEIAPVDLPRLLAVPVPRLAGARRSRTMEATIEGDVPDRPLQHVDAGHLKVAHPVDFEVPDRLRAILSKRTGEAHMIDAVGASLGVPGDCLARARFLADRLVEGGFDAHTVVGLVYLDEDRDPAFWPHAWVEVDLPTGRVPVDPTLGEPVADAARIVLADDGPDAPWQVMRRAATLHIEGVSWR
jgi:hypothetical protein